MPQSNQTDLPRRKDTAWLGKVESRSRVIGIETDEKSSDTEWAYTTGLCVFLLDSSNVTRNVFDRHWVFDSQAMRLALYAGFVDEDTSVCV